MLDATLRRYQGRQDALIEVLHSAQNLYGYLTPELMWYVAGQLRLPPSKVYGVATFYNFFTLKPAGAHTCVICQGTACYIKGAPQLATAMQEAFGVEPGGTTADGQLSLVVARCIGSCGLAPAAILDGEVLSRMTPETLVARVKQALSGQPAQAAAAETGGAAR